MKTLTARIFIILPLVALSRGLPFAVPRRDLTQTVNLTFYGDQAPYRMSFPANGYTFATNNSLSVAIIDCPGYNALTQCVFETDEPAELVGNIAQDGTQQVVVGPPQPIRSVHCEGTCVPQYGMCYDDNGQSAGSCCSGFCDPQWRRCMPWNVPIAPIEDSKAEDVEDCAPEPQQQATDKWESEGGQGEDEEEAEGLRRTRSTPTMSDEMKASIAA